MGGLRTLRDEIPLPPQGAVTLAVARHTTPTYPHPDLPRRHRERSAAIHALIDEAGLEVTDWGQTDSDTPREIVDVIVPIVTTAIPAVASILAAWVSVRGAGRKGRDKDTAPVLGFAIQTADGSRIEFTYKNTEEYERVVASIEKIMKAAALNTPHG